MPRRGYPQGPEPGPVAVLVRPPIAVTVTYWPTTRRIEIHASGDDPDLVLVALTKAQAAVLRQDLRLLPPSPGGPDV